MRIGNDSIVLSSNDMSISLSGEAIWLGHISDFSIQLVFTGSPAGSFKLQCSNDKGGSPERPEITNWTDIAGSTQLISGAGDHVWNYENCGFRWVRFVWIPTSGSGLINVASMNVKGT
jgi:hypothetical protein